MKIMKFIKKLFATPVRAIVTCFCMLAVICIAGMAVAVAVVTNSIQNQPIREIAYVDNGTVGAVNQSGASHAELTNQAAQNQATVQNEASSQTAGQTDAANQAAVQNNASSQTTGQTDAANQAAAQNNASSQTTGQTDAASQAAVQNEASSQTTGQTDAANQAAAQNNASSQTTGQTDAASQQAAQNNASSPAQTQSSTTSQAAQNNTPAQSAPQTNRASAGVQNNAAITVETATSTALADAGLSASDVTFTKQRYEREDGIFVYEIDFFTSSAKYDYEINASTGEIYSRSVETFQTGGNWGNSGTSYIGVDAAKSAALSHAGISNSSGVTFGKAKLENDDGYTLYEIEFYANGMEYDYNIDAFSGAVLEYDSERWGW